MHPLRPTLILAGIAGLGLGLAGLAGLAARESAASSAAPLWPDPLALGAGPWQQPARELAGDPRPAAPPVPLPPEPDAVVVRLEATDEPSGRLLHRLTIRADGRAEAVVMPPAGPESPAGGRLAAAELQDLLRFVVRDQEFFAFDAGAVDRDLRRGYEYDGRLDSPSDRATTRIRLRTADREHEVGWSQLGSAVVLFHGEVRLRQLGRVERRLRNVLLVLAAGGPGRVGPVADWLTDRLRLSYPDLAPFTAADLSEYAPAADGSGARFAFSRGDKFDPAGHYFAAAVLAPGRGPPALVSVIPRSSRAPPTAARHWCLPPRPAEGGPPGD
jgi:hypothetical protein